MVSFYGSGETCSAAPVSFALLGSTPWEGKKKIRGKQPRISFGGDKRDRTADLLNAIQALSQLSYTPIFTWRPLLCFPRGA